MTKYRKKTKFSLDDKISNSKFNYTKNLKWFLIAPIVIVLVGIILLCTLGFNLGMDFTGGSNMKIFVDSEGAYSEQVYDVDKDLNEIENKINKVLKEYDLSVKTIQKTTISVEGMLDDADAVLIKYQNDNEEYNKEIRIKLLKEFGFIDENVEDLELETNAELVSQGNVTSASASSELMMKSFIALLVAVVLILIYVAFRFEFTSGLAAILALFHDLLVTASVMLICRVEISVSFIAALITILGYSINNTIIIFDRMRDDLKVAKKENKPIDNHLIANRAVRETMMRSVLTGFTTFVSIFMITVIGVTDIREFAFPIMVGILAGFYSSVFLTPGLWAIAYKPRKRKKIKKEDTVDENIEII